MEKLKSIDYTSKYAIFKKIPFILFVASVILSVLLCFLDCAIWFTEMEFKILLWPLIGVALGFVNWFFSSIFISPIVIITDAKIKEQEKE